MGEAKSKGGRDLTHGSASESRFPLPGVSGLPRLCEDEAKSQLSSLYNRREGGFKSVFPNHFDSKSQTLSTYKEYANVIIYPQLFFVLFLFLFNLKEKKHGFSLNFIMKNNLYQNKNTLTT